MAKPFIKLAGGKSRLLAQIRPKYPAGLGLNINKYAEPFVGGGAVLFDVLNNYPLRQVYISDINRELICTYTTIRDNPELLIDALRAYEAEYLQKCEDGRKETYYNKRDRFNFLKHEGIYGVEIASLFVFLNRTCFNGLYRVNAKGGFNVPQGKYENPLICDEVNLVNVSKVLQDIEIVCGDYSLSQNFIDENTFVYFDPPYRPLSETSSFTAYTQDGFCDQAQIELAGFIDKISRRGAYVLASNSDPRNTNENDDFFDVLYSRHNITRILAGRAINSSSGGRGKINEILISS